MWKTCRNYVWFFQLKLLGCNEKFKRHRNLLIVCSLVYCYCTYSIRHCLCFVHCTSNFAVSTLQLLTLYALHYYRLIAHSINNSSTHSILPYSLLTPSLTTLLMLSATSLFISFCYSAHSVIQYSLLPPWGYYSLLTPL